MNKESILILGGGIMQIPAIKAAKDLGYRLFIADVNPDAPGITLADKFCKIDLKDYRAIAEEAVKLKAEQNLAAVFTAGTDFSATVAYAAAAAELPGIDYAAAMTASNKILMRRAFSAAGVPSPSFFSVKSLDEAIDACMNIDFPVVIKPVDSMGARGVVKINSIEDEEAIASAVEDAITTSRSSEAIVEEYMGGAEFSLDALVYDGEITICGFADRHIFFPPYFIEMGHTMPTSYSEEVKEQVINVFKQGIRAIGITEGAAKGDIKYSPEKGAMVGEIAARLSGGFMSGWTFPYHSGIDLTKAAIKIASGRAPGRLRPERDYVSAERALLSIPGEVESVEGIEDAESVKYVQDVFLHTAPGKRVVFPVNNVQKCANCISSSADYDSAVSAAEDAVRKIFIRLKSGDKETSDFLKYKSYLWVPDAFTLSDKLNIKFLLQLEKSGAAGILPSLDSEPDADWHGLGLQQAFLTVKKLTACPDSCFTAAFWKAFLRGGVQGAVWQIETESKRFFPRTETSGK